MNFHQIKQIRIAITGPESTGKTTLAKQLAEVFHGHYFPEHAREYIENLPSPYTFEDVEEIARAQVEQYRSTNSLPEQIFFFDTWLIITKIWFVWVYSRVPSWLDKEIKSCPIGLFLICSPDFPWEADSVRENGGENRIKLFNLYLDELKHYGFNFVEINGSGSIRLENAMNAIRTIYDLP